MSWLPDMDLNHDKQIQSLLCYRYTIGQRSSLLTRGPPYFGGGLTRHREHGPLTRGPRSPGPIEGSAKAEAAARVAWESPRGAWRCPGGHPNLERGLPSAAIERPMIAPRPDSPAGAGVRRDRLLAYERHKSSGRGTGVNRGENPLKGPPVGRIRRAQTGSLAGPEGSGGSDSTESSDPG